MLGDEDISGVVGRVLGAGGVNEGQEAVEEREDEGFEIVQTRKTKKKPKKEMGSKTATETKKDGRARAQQTNPYAFLASE